MLLVNEKLGIQSYFTTLPSTNQSFEFCLPSSSLDSSFISLARETEMAGALVGGAFLSASLKVLIDRLASPEMVDFIGGHKLNDALLMKLKKKLLTVHAVLDDAEAKKITDLAVKEWMDELKVFVHDAQDALDEIATEHLRCKIEAVADSQTSMSMSTFDVQSIKSRVEDIIDRLKVIVQERDVLGLKEGVGEKRAQRCVDHDIAMP